MNGLEISLTIPDLWQQDAVRALREGRDVVVHAPTGAGKTYIFELLYPVLKGQAVFTVPTRALANDKLAEWRAKGWDVGIATGDVAYRTDAKVVVATLETQKANFLRRKGPRLLVIDEYQMIADEVRGVNYELAVALAPPGTQLLLLSGSVANPQDVVAWLRRIGRDAVLVSHQERPVPLDWPAMLGVMRVAAERGEEPFAAADEVAARLFTTQRIDLGVAHARETGPMPCGLFVDMERARFARRTVVEMRNSRGEWEPRPAASAAELGCAMDFVGGRWQRALQFARTLEGVGFGTFCKLAQGQEKTYGRELPLGTLEKERRRPAGASQRPNDAQDAAEAGQPEDSGETPPLPCSASHVVLAKWLRPKLEAKRVSRARLEEEVLRRLASLTDGGRLAELVTRNTLLVARLDFSHVETTAFVDSHGCALRNPQVRETRPACCDGCHEFERFCNVTEIGLSPAHAWRRLVLVDERGVPTRRGVIFSFFNSGEGLAVAAALEAEKFAIDDLVFDLANLRAGHRFAGDDSPFGGRLGILYQTTFERALVEWRSLLRHIVRAPDYDWPRWRALKQAAAKFVEDTGEPLVLHLPPLLGPQLRREVPRSLFARHTT